MGFNPTSENFNFGAGPRGSLGIKHFNISNQYNHKIRLEILFEGNISNFLKVNPNKKYFDINEIQIFEITANILSNTSLGQYSGKVIFSFYKI